MTQVDLSSPLASLFKRLISDDSIGFAGWKSVACFNCPTLLPENRRFGPHKWTETLRFFPFDGMAPELCQIGKEWPEFRDLGEALSEFVQAAQLPHGFVEFLRTRIFDQVFEHYFERFNPFRREHHQLGPLRDGIDHWHFTTSVIDDSILGSCSEITARYQADINRKKEETLYILMEGLAVDPLAEIVELSEDVSVVHVAQLPTFAVREILRLLRNRAIDCFPHYWVRQRLTPIDEYRSTCSSKLAVLERIERTTASFRLAKIGWLAAPLGIAVSSLIWNEARVVSANTTLSWQGYYELRVNQDDHRRVGHYLTLIDKAAFPSFLGDQPYDASYAYLLWALKQLRFMAEARNDAARASHLFMLIDALFGKRDNSSTTWQRLPKKLFNPRAIGYQDIASVMEVAYTCRCNLMHEGITPPQRFFDKHFAFLWELAIATLGWIVENCDLPEIGVKSGFVNYLRTSHGGRGPQAISSALCAERFSARIPSLGTAR